MEAYGLYKKVRNAAWRCLIDNGIDRLPVDVLALARNLDIQVKKNSDVMLLTSGESGICIQTDGEWYVVYDDECGVGRKRVIVAHELGHILLGHERYNGPRGSEIDKRKPGVERDADMFAARLLAPACVLWGLGLHTADDIARECGLSVAFAKTRAVRMDELYKREKFLTHPLERKVFGQFAGYLDEKRQAKE